MDRSADPPVPHILETPLRQLTAGWAEYALPDGSAYFYNVETGVSSWQPPPEPAPEDAEMSVSEADLLPPRLDSGVPGLQHWALMRSCLMPLECSSAGH